MLKNLPPNAGDMGLIPSQGTKIPQATEQPSLLATTTEPTCHSEIVHEQQHRQLRSSTTKYINNKIKYIIIEKLCTPGWC